MAKKQIGYGSNINKKIAQRTREKLGKTTRTTPKKLGGVPGEMLGKPASRN